VGALSYWGVKVWTAVGGTSYDVPNVQSISFSYGRTQPTDDFPAAQATVTGILPDDLPALFKEVNSPVSFDLYDLDGNRRARYWVMVKSLTRTYGTIENLDTPGPSISGLSPRQGRRCSCRQHISLSKLFNSSDQGVPG